MPDFTGSLKPRAGVVNPTRGRVGGSTPALLRTNSVAVAVQGIGTSGPLHAPAAGVLALATAVRVPGVIAAVEPFDPNDLDALQSRQFTGGRPSGIGEAIKTLRDAYRRGELNAREDARQFADRALAVQDAAVRRYNAFAVAHGLPTLELPSDVLVRLVTSEGQSIGSAAAPDGVQVGVEVMPAWRADP